MKILFKFFSHKVAFRMKEKLLSAIAVYMSCFLHNIIGTIYMYYYIFYFDWNVFIPKLIFPKTKMFSSRKICGLMFQNRPFVFQGGK